MEFEIRAGAKLDLVSPQELRETLQAWHAEIVRGPKPGAVSIAARPAGPGRFEAEIGPPPGFMWAVTTVMVSGTGYDPAADTYTLYRGDPSPTRALAHAPIAAPGIIAPIGSIVIPGGDSLVVAGTQAVPAGAVVVSLSYVEVPVQLAYRLLG